MYSGLFEFSQRTRCLMNSRQRFRGVSSTADPLPFLGVNSLRPASRTTNCRKLSGHSGSSGSGISEAKTTARHAASGRRAHQMCSVEICPCRIDFSRADCSETSFNGKATSMRRLSIDTSDLYDYHPHVVHWIITFSKSFRIQELWRFGNLLSFAVG